MQKQEKTQKLNRFFEGSKTVSLYSMAQSDKQSPFRKLLKVGLLSAVTIFSSACSSLKTVEQGIQVDPATQEYAQKLDKIEGRFQGRSLTDISMQFFNPAMFLKYQGGYGEYSKFEGDIKQILPEGMNTDGFDLVDPYQALTKRDPTAFDMRGYDGKLQACIIVPADTVLEEYHTTPQLDEDFSQHSNFTLPQRQLYTNYHEMWHCIYDAMQPDYDPNDYDHSRDDQFYHFYKNESFADVGAAIDMLKDGHVDIVQHIKEFRTIPLLVAPKNMNAESSMTHYTIPALLELEKRVEEKGRDYIAGLEGQELTHFVNDVVESSALSKAELEAVTSVLISQPDQLNRWADEYAAYDKADRDTAFRVGQDAQKNIVAVTQKLNPEKAGGYKFTKMTMAHNPEIYVDHYKLMIEKLQKMTKND